MDKQSFKAIAIFCALGIVLIVSVDYALSMLGFSVSTIKIIHELKGWFFVFVTAVFASYLVTRKNRERSTAPTFLKQFSVATEQIVESIIVTDKNGIIKYVNPAFEKMTGYTRDEVIGKTPRVLKSGIHDQEFYRRLWDTISAGIIFRTEFTNRKKNGELIVEDRTISPIRNEKGEIIFFVASGLDSTERKRIEGELHSSQQQLRNLAANLHSHREQESARIAREIHDELGQSLTGLKIDLLWLLKKLGQDPSEIIPVIQNRVHEMASLIDETIGTVRRISTELRPSILDDFGLAAAIEWQAQEFEKKTTVRCELRFEPSTDFDLSKEYATTLFRIFQEALTNIIRHAEATQVVIELKKEDNTVFLEISDDGKGITEKQITHHTSLGILGMKERAYLFGGTVAFAANQPHGTRIRITLPLLLL